MKLCRKNGLRTHRTEISDHIFFFGIIIYYHFNSDIDYKKLIFAYTQVDVIWLGITDTLNSVSRFISEDESLNIQHSFQ